MWIARPPLVIAVLLLIIGSWPMQTGHAQRTVPIETGRIAVQIDVEGVIGPATVRHVSQGLAEARARNAAVVMLRIDTPGGLVTSMRETIAAILASPVPVIGYVAPSGGRAASAGMYILMATHVAAMAPGTNVGAATPIQLGGSPLPSPTPTKDKDAPKDAGDVKAINDAAAFARSLAELRGRNAEWAERAVREGVSASASEALKLGVIELIAPDLSGLLNQIDGRTVTAGNSKLTLATRGLVVERIAPSMLTEVLSLIANPNVALILLMIGVYGIIFEFATPGSYGPGAVGAVALVLGLYALNQLPFNYAGLALVLIGLACMIAEAFLPTFGILGIVGIVSFVIGALFLIDTNVPAFQVSWPVIATTAAASVLMLSLVLGLVARSVRRPVPHGVSDLVGREAEVVDWSGDAGHVWVHGERWNARGLQGAAPGRRVKVVAVDGLVLVVGA